MTDFQTTPPTLALSPRGAARALGISERLLWAKTKAGEIPHRRIGKRILYPVHLLREWLESDN
jgi:excisionase family DNA binding protein